MNCKPGDLAVVTFDDTCPQNIDRLVTVIERYTGHISGWEHVGPVWTIVPCSTLVSVKTDYETGQMLSPPESHTDECEHPDAWLRPITPPPGSVSDEEVKNLWLPSPTKQTESEKV